MYLSKGKSLTCTIGESLTYFGVVEGRFFRSPFLPFPGSPFLQIGALDGQQQDGVIPRLFVQSCSCSGEQAQMGQKRSIIGQRKAVCIQKNCFSPLFHISL